MRNQLISLFCGAGGLDLGFHKAGFETVLAADHFEDAIKTFNLNFPNNVAKEIDLSRIKPDRLLSHLPCGAKPVGVIGGPPCQSFSNGNVCTKSDDPRSQLPYRYANLLAAANAKYSLHFFVFENVVGLLRPKHAKRLARIKSLLTEAGFNISQSILNARDFGVPQNRQRVFIVGLNSAIYPNLFFTPPVGDEDPKTIQDVLKGLPNPTFFKRGLKAEEIPYHSNHWTMVPKSPKFNNNQMIAGRSFKRLDWNSISPTVAYGHREIHVHPDGGRRLSVYEAMLLQGFPATFHLTGCFSSQITQVSNAVSPPVAMAIANALLKIISNKDTDIVKSNGILRPSVSNAA